MKKIAIATLLFSVSLVLMTEQAYAVEVGNEQTDVGISYKTDGANKPGQGPYKDNLAIAWVPSNFNFGSQKAIANVATYNNAVEGDQYMVVNDDRPDKTLSGWKVSATLSDLVSADDSKVKLPAKLTFNLEKPKAYDIGKEDPLKNDYAPNPVEGNLKELPAETNIIIGDGTSTAISLEAGKQTGTQVISKKVADTYKGGAATKLSSTKLVVTSSDVAAGKAFNGTVTWSLDNTY